MELMCIICPVTVWEQSNFWDIIWAMQFWGLIHECGAVWNLYKRWSETRIFSLSFLCMEKREQSFLKLHLHICHLGLSAGSKTLHSNQCLKEEPKFLESINFPSSAFPLLLFYFTPQSLSSLYAVLLIDTWLLYHVSSACKANDAHPHC